MDFKLTRAQEMLKNMVREFAEQEIAPKIPEFEKKEGEFPFEVIRRMGELGLTGLLVPKDYGGNGMGYLAMMVAIEELARVFPAFGGHLRGCNLLPYLITNYGTEDQKKRFLPRLCRGEIMGSLATTEHTGGSDPLSMETTARREGDHYVINGRKVMISRGAESQLIALSARTGEGNNISCFLVEKGTPGFEAGRREDLISTQSRCSPISELVFYNCRVPKENMVGQEGRGLGPVLATIGSVGRTGGAAVCLGIAQGSFEAALKYARERKLYGKPLTELQTIRHWLGEMAMKIEMGRLMNYYVGWLLDQGKKAREIAKEGAIAKLHASEAAIDVTLKAIEIHGGYGTSSEYRVIQRMKTALDMIAAAGSNNVMRETIANNVVKQ